VCYDDSCYNKGLYRQINTHYSKRYCHEHKTADMKIIGVSLRCKTNDRNYQCLDNNCSLKAC
jgi:hypothetical protein